MTRRKIITLLADSRDTDPHQVPLDHGVQLFQALQSAVRDGSMAVSAGDADVLLRFAPLTDIPALAPRLVRADASLWQGRLSVIQPLGQGCTVASIIRQANRFHVWAMLPEGEVGLSEPAAPARDVEIARDLARSIHGHCVSRGQGPEALSALGREKYFAVLNNRLHDGLYAFASARLLARTRTDARYAVLRTGSLLSLGDVSSAPAEAMLACGAGDITRMRNDPEISWIEAAMLPTRQVHAAMADIVRELAGVPAHPGEPPDRRDGAVCLYFSYEAEKRSWLEQEDGFVRFCTELGKRHPAITVLLNGMTGSITGETEGFFPAIRAAEEAFMARVCAACPHVRFEHLFARSLPEKIHAIRHADFFVGPALSAVLVPIFLDIPGYVYGPAGMRAMASPFVTGRAQVRVAPAGITREVSEDIALVDYSWAKGAPDGTSYSMPPDAFVTDCLGHFLATVPERPRPRQPGNGNRKA